MSRHNISYAGTVLQGNAYYPPFTADYEGSRGLPVDLPIFHSFGGLAIADPDALIKAATSTELPDTETVTYTFATDGGTSPLDGVSSDGIIGSTANKVGRNITATTTHGSSVVAMTIVVNGTDIYGDVISETITVAATGTTQNDAGAKAFYSVTSIAITAAADAEANTLNMGFGDVIGLPYRIDDKNKVIPMFDGGVDAATVVAGDDTTATATTGDVRGTIDPDGTLDGTKLLGVMFLSPFRDTKENAFGIDNFAG